MIQIISEDLELDADALTAEISADEQFNGAGLDYNMVAVFGSQSTGKSTLLNRLFSTEFACMSSGARQQTTKGLWLAKAKGAVPPLLVMDVEGTDGRERGENQGSILPCIPISQNSSGNLPCFPLRQHKLSL